MRKYVADNVLKNEKKKLAPELTKAKSQLLEVKKIKCFKTGNYLSEAEIEWSLKYSQKLWLNTVHSGYINSGCHGIHMLELFRRQQFTAAKMFEISVAPSMAYFLS